MANIAVIGGGITGLVASLRLSQLGHRLVIFEKEQTTGGLVQSTSLGTETVETIYHHIFTSDSHVKSLLDELGISHHLRYYSPSNGLQLQNKTYPFSSPLDLLKFRAIPFSDRIKTGLTVLKAGKIKEYLELENELASTWLCKNGGKRAYEKLWRPLLISKFGEASDTISAVWIWNKFKLRGGSRADNKSQELLGYLDGGFGVLSLHLTSLLNEQGVTIRTNTPVTEITPKLATNSQKWHVATATTGEEFDGVIFACADTLLPSIMDTTVFGVDYSSKIANSRWMANICLLLELNKSVSPYYWTTVCDDSPYVAMIEHTNLLQRKMNGKHVLYLSRYLDKTCSLWQLSDDEITKLFIDTLITKSPGLLPDDILSSQLLRSPFAQPVVGCKHSQLYATSDTPLPSFKLASMAQIYPEDRGVNYAIKLGDDVATSLHKELSHD